MSGSRTRSPCRLVTDTSSTALARSSSGGTHRSSPAPEDRIEDGTCLMMRSAPAVLTTPPLAQSRPAHDRPHRLGHSYARAPPRGRAGRSAQVSAQPQAGTQSTAVPLEKEHHRERSAASPPPEQAPWQGGPGGD